MGFSSGHPNAAWARDDRELLVFLQVSCVVFAWMQRMDAAHHSHLVDVLGAQAADRD